jgi:flagellar hook-associated protein 3 FlgL
MLAGLDAYTSTFLSALNTTENRINTANEQLSSGYRVNQPSDDPGAIEAILGYQSQIDQVTQTQSNLSQATTMSNVADSALSTASNMLNQLSSIATEGASSTSSATQNASLGQQVQGILKQLVSVANTSFNGSYVFGGDDPTTQPYTFNWSVPGGVVQNNTASVTVAVTNSDGDSLVIPPQTAQQIFDARNADGSVAASNIFQNVYALGQALQSNNQAGIQAAASSITTSIVQLGQATTASGVTLNWLQQSSSSATSKLTSLQSQLSGLRDADAAQAATDLQTAETAQQAAIAAHGTLTNLKSLFSYFG